MPLLSGPIDNGRPERPSFWERFWNPRLTDQSNAMIVSQNNTAANPATQNALIEAMTGRPTLPANFATSAFPRPQQPRPQGGPGSPASGGTPSGTPSATPDLTQPGAVGGLLSQAMNQIGHIANQVGRDQGPVQGFGGLAAALNAPRDEPPPLPQLQPVNTPLNLAEQPMPDANLESAAGFGGQADARLNPRPANPLLAALGGGGNRPAQQPQAIPAPFFTDADADAERRRVEQDIAREIRRREEEQREMQPATATPRTLANGPSQFRPMTSGQYLFR